MNPRRNKFFPQLPPPETFITLLRLLTQHGASVHEIVHGRLLTTLNVQRSDYGCQTLEFFRLLIKESYTDFNAIDNLGWSALLSAIRTKGTAVEAIKLLINANVDISRIMPDGRSALHLASEMADDVNVLEYLYACGPHSINRQDNSGFTPLHYCVLGGFQQNRPLTLEKIIFLLERGADPEMRGTNQVLGADDEGVGVVTPFELSKLLTRKFPCLDLETIFVDAMKAVGHIFSEDSFFVDAAEYLPRSR